MPTENDDTIEVAPRDISVLMNLDTYQDMTDEEINMVLDFKIQEAVNSANNKAVREQNAQTNAYIEQSQASIVSETRALLDSLRAVPLSLGVVEGVDA